MIVVGRRVLEPRNGRGVPQVIFAFAAELVLAAEIKLQAKSLRELGVETRPMAGERLASDLVQPDAAYP